MKRVISILLTLVMIGVVYLPVSAQVAGLPCDVAASNGRIIRINIDPAAVGDVDDFLISDLAEQYKNDPSVGSITIHEVGYAYSPQVLEPFASSPKVSSKKIYTLKNGKKKEVLAVDKFIISVARGEVRTLGKKWSFSLKLDISGQTPFKLKELGLEGALTFTVDAGSKWDGPPESSQYNSREYLINSGINSGGSCKSASMKITASPFA